MLLFLFPVHLTSPVFPQNPGWMMKERRNEWMEDDTAHKSREGQEGARRHCGVGVGCEFTDNYTFLEESSHVEKHLSLWYGSDRLNGPCGQLYLLLSCPA